MQYVLREFIFFSICGTMPLGALRGAMAQPWLSSTWLVQFRIWDAKVGCKDVEDQSSAVVLAVCVCM